ncbi:unnamed protein product [Leptidea sinapis]|uniref:Uncharacterized protein n=1 Tax=Leptidea sinapis TaxID=189913 RepID=A0A5E4QXE1_9NEOP|nr:unnamed protein product [Leptidea sinapis]
MKSIIVLFLVITSKLIYSKSLTGFQAIFEDSSDSSSDETYINAESVNTQMTVVNQDGNTTAIHNIFC